MLDAIFRRAGEKRRPGRETRPLPSDAGKLLVYLRSRGRFLRGLTRSLDQVVTCTAARAFVWPR